MMNVCLSGGAEGADLEWGRLAKLYGHKVIHYSFGKHKSKGGVPCTILSQDDLNVADPFLKAANKVLKRSFPARSLYINNLLRRNYYQTKDSKCLYAVINGFDKDNSAVVNGGTAWAVEMFIQTRKYPLYVYDQISKQWYTWSDSFEGGGWIPYAILPPNPCAIWTGIGTRELTEDGIAAMASVFGD